MKISCIITDDEPLARKGLQGYIEKIDFFELSGVCEDALQLNTLLKQKPSDLLFLDIEMPYITGIDFLKTAFNPPKVIFTTAYEQYAIKGFEMNVLDYLLKPVSFERFTKAVRKLPPLVNTEPARMIPHDYFFVKSEYKLLRIDFSQVLYLEALRDYVAIHTTDGNKILTLQSLSSFEKELPAHLFSRIHKSYLAAISKISFIEKNRVVISGRDLPVGETYKAAFLQKINHPNEK